MNLFMMGHSDNVWNIDDMDTNNVFTNDPFKTDVEHEYNMGSQSVITWQ